MNADTISAANQTALRILERGFMHPVIEQGNYYEVDTSFGMEIVPVDVAGDGATLESVRDYCEGEPLEITRKSGYLARLSAPGYMDCTEWSAFDTADEAASYLVETYAND
jgi:hypothetical protein